MKAQSNNPLPKSIERWKEGEYIYYYNHIDNGVQSEDNEGERYEADFVITKSTEKTEIEKALIKAIIDPELNQKIIDNIEIEGKKSIDIERDYTVTKEIIDEVTAIIKVAEIEPIIIKR